MEISDNTDTQSTAANRKQWTILVYMAADNNLSELAQQRLREFKAIDVPETVNLVVYLDTKGAPTERHLISHDRREVEKLETNLNFGAGKVLHGFVQSTLLEAAKQNHKLALIIWNHGGGWQQAASDMNDLEDKLSIQELRAAIAGIGELQLLGFDSCLMSMAEVALYMRGTASTMIASETLAPAGGWPVREMLADLARKSDRTPLEVAGPIPQQYKKKFASSSQHGTLTALDLKKLAPMEKALVALAEELGNMCLNEGKKASLRAARRKMVALARADLVDLQSMLDRLVAAEPSLASRAAEVSAGLATALIDATRFGTQNENKCGLSIYFPPVYTASEDGFTTPPDLATLEDHRSLGILGGAWSNFLDKLLHENAQAIAAE